MRIDVITKYEDFVRLKETWNRLYEKDPEAQFFLSWIFFSTYLRRFEGEWFILAARPGPEGTPYVALLPLRLRTRMNKKTGRFHNEINMCGNYAADYTGILCAPDFADRAIPALAKHLKQMHWAKLHLENLRMSEKKLRLLLKQFSDKKLTVRELSRINKTDNVDNSKCPSVELQATWDDYLAANVGSGTRQKIRRFLRKAEASPEFRITVADASTIDRDLEILLQLWRKKWGKRKGNRLASIERSNRLLYKNGFETGTLFLPVLWHGDKPLGAMAIFIDETKKSMLFHMAGRDETSDVIPSGLVLHAYSIRHGIEQGFRTYDFLRGNEPYKYSFGARETVINCRLVQTVTGRNLSDQLDPRSLSSVFREASQLHQGTHLNQAERAYRQILQVDPAHARTLYGLGQLLSTKGDHWEAAKTFEALVAIAPSSVKAWSRLALAFQALNRHLDAAGAFRKALELKPGFPLAQDGLARSLVELKLNDARGTSTVLHDGAGTNLALSAMARTQTPNLQPVCILKDLTLKDRAKASLLPVPEVGIVGAVQRLLATQSRNGTEKARTPSSRHSSVV